MKTKIKELFIVLIVCIAICAPIGGLMYVYFYLPNWIFMCASLALIFIFLFRYLYKEIKKEDAK